MKILRKFNIPNRIFEKCKSLWLPYSVNFNQITAEYHRCFGLIDPKKELRTYCLSIMSLWIIPEIIYIGIYWTRILNTTVTQTASFPHAKFSRFSLFGGRLNILRFVKFGSLGNKLIPIGWNLKFGFRI